MNAWLTIIGVGEAGIADLAPSLQQKIITAPTIIGAPRFLARLAATPGRHLIEWAPPLAAMIATVLARRGAPTLILATGDPNWFGIAASLRRDLGPEEIEIHPHPSAFQLAAARLGWPLQHVVALSLHGRSVETLHANILPGNKILALTSDRTTLAAAVEILTARGYGNSQVWTLENLGGPDERVTNAPATKIHAPRGDFYVLAIMCTPTPEAPLLAAVPGLPDTVFRHDGQLTKREIRAVTLAKLSPYPGARLWDVGAGCGSIAIEWLRAARDTTAIAFEADPARLEFIAANARALGVPGLEIVPGHAPQTLENKAVPDAVFIGGAVGDIALFEACWQALRPGGRLVANAVTLDGEQALYARHARFGGTLVRLDISVLETIGTHRGFRPKMPVTQWLGVKP